MPQIAAFRGTLGTTPRDSSRALYRYHQIFDQGGRQVTRKSVIAVVRMSPWSEREIRAHEASDPAVVATELATLRATKTQQPIFVGFRDASGEVERQFRGIDGSRPVLEHTTPDGTMHKIFRVQSAEILGPLQRGFAPKKLHVLDGHARYEAMLAYGDELDAKSPLSMYSTGKYALAVMTNLDDVTVYQTTVARHRVVRGTLEPAAVIAAAKGKFIVEPITAIPAMSSSKLAAALADTVAHQPAFAIAFKNGPAYKLTLAPDVSLARQGVPVNRALQKMDPVVFELAFRPAALGDAKVTSELDLAKALASDADAVIAMRAVSLTDLIHVDELGELLPVNSTAFAPALAPQITTTIDPNEDVQ